MHRNRNGVPPMPPAFPQPFVPSGHALREPHDRSQYQASPPTHPFPASRSPPPHPYQPHPQPSLQIPHPQESQSLSYASTDSGSLMNESERHRQRLTQGWAFNSQPPSLPPVGQESRVQDGRRRGDADRVVHGEGTQHQRSYGYPGHHQAYPPYAYASHPDHQHPYHPVPLHRPPPSAHTIQQYPIQHHMIPSERPPPPMNYSGNGSRHTSPRASPYDRATHSPAVVQHFATPAGSSMDHGRMGSMTAADHHHTTDRRLSSGSGSGIRQSPVRDAGGTSDGRNGRRVLGLAAGMASPEQSMRSSRGGESYGDHHVGYPEVGSHAESIHQAQIRHAAYPHYPIPSTQMADAELLTSMRYGQHPPLVRQQAITPLPPIDRIQQVHQMQGAASARSSVVPGTPSERGGESLHTDHEFIEDPPRRTPFREYSRSLDPPVEPTRNGMLGSWGTGNRVIAVASSPEPVIRDASSPPENPRGQFFSNAGTRAEESLELEPTQRNEEVVEEVPMRTTPAKRAKTPAKTPAKGQNPPVAQTYPKHILPRPANTAPDTTDDDTFILSQDRKVALKKRSNAEIEACMGNGISAPAEVVSPNKRKKVGKQRDLVGAEGRKVPGRGELQNRKVAGAMAALARSGVKDGGEPLPEKVSPPRKTNDNGPVVQDPKKPKESRDDVVLPTDSSTSTVADGTINVSSRIAPYRRLQKTSAAGSSGPSSEPVSLRGIDEYERHGDGQVEQNGMEEMQAAGILEAEVTMDLEVEKSNDGPLDLNAPLDLNIDEPVDPPLRSPGLAVNGAEKQRSRSTSLTSAPLSDDEEPRVETLVVPSPQRYKTYKSPAKKRKIGCTRTSSPSDHQASASETDDSPQRRKAVRKSGPTKKIMSPTASPPSHEKSREVRSHSSSDSLSEAPREEKWDDVPPPAMKDDPRDRDFRPLSHSQIQSSPARKIATRRKSMTPRPTLQFKRVLGSWNGSYYTGTLIGKKNRKYTVQFDDEPSGYDRLYDELRQCVFHVGDQVSLHHSMERKLNESGTFAVLGPVDDELDMASPLLADDMLRLKGKKKKVHEVAVKYCTFDEDNEEALNDRFFDEDQLAEMCAMSDSNRGTKAKKPAKDDKPKLAEKRTTTRPLLRGQYRSDSRLERSRPLQNFAFVISSSPNVEGKSAAMKSYKAKITNAGGRVMDDFFDFYPKPRGNRIGADDLVLSKHHLALNGIFLLILPPKEPKPPFLTEKFMMALALGIPCLSATYIDEFLDEEETASWRSFLLSAGLSHQLKSEVSQVVNWNTGEGPQHLVRKIDAEGVTRRPFANRSFLITHGVNDVIPYVCAAMGAETVILPEGKLRSRKGTSAPPSATPSVISEDTSNRSAADVDFIIVPDDAPKSRSKKNAEKTCNVEWVKQCLIMGKLYQPSIMERVAHTNGK